jgi:hypothetical protein
MAARSRYKILLSFHRWHGFEAFSDPADSGSWARLEANAWT